MDILRTRPYTPADQLFDQFLNQMFTPFSSANSNGGSTGYQSFPVNLWQSNDAYHAAMLVPGLDEQKLNVTVHEGTLTIEGELPFETPEGAKIVWQEFGPARFRRSMNLGGAVDAERVDATYRNGILLITLPKAEHAKPRQVQVRIGGSAEQVALPKGQQKRTK